MSGFQRVFLAEIAAKERCEEETKRAKRVTRIRLKEDVG
jgi:hypothetical protein